jgi:hypothetical protein
MEAADRLFLKTNIVRNRKEILGTLSTVLSWHAKADTPGRRDRLLKMACEYMTWRRPRMPSIVG